MQPHYIVMSGGPASVAGRVFPEPPGARWVCDICDDYDDAGSLAECCAELLHHLEHEHDDDEEGS